MEREKLLNIPNVLTGLRILLIGIFLTMHFARPSARGLSMAIFILAGLTDFLDGFIARRCNQITWLGKLLDPLADKFMILSVLVCLMFSYIMPAWAVALIVVKELYMVTGASLLFKRDYVVCSDGIGKVSTFLFVPAAILLYPWHSVPWLYTLGGGLMSVSIVLSFAAAVHYTVDAVKKSRALKTD